MPSNNLLTVVTSVNPLRAYSGVKYLCDALYQGGIPVRLYAGITRRLLPETKNWLYPTHSLWMIETPKVRSIPARVRVLRLGLADSAPMMFVDLVHFAELLLVKKLRPRKKIIHYCAELYGEHMATLPGLISLYGRFAGVPDLIIDVEPSRATIRQQRYGLARTPLVIPNSVPLTAIPQQAAPGALAQLAGTTLPTDRPILLYTGGATLDRGWSILAEALGMMQPRPFFLAFCHTTSDAEVASLRSLFLTKIGADEFWIHGEAPRQELFACIHQADAGIVYYPPSISPNHLYAAPSKLYEYIAAGLPVVTASNPNIVKMVRDLDVGVSAADESPDSLAEALRSLFYDKERLSLIRQRQPETFRTRLAYEIVALPEVKKIIDFLKA